MTDKYKLTERMDHYKMYQSPIVKFFWSNFSGLVHFVVKCKTSFIYVKLSNDV